MQYNERPSRGRATVSRCAVGIALGLTGVAAAGASDVTELGLEQLMQVRVIGASKFEQKQGEVAAAASVITRAEIRSFGWRTLEEALGSLPGVYVTYDRQYTYLGTRGFGVPGDYNTRLLVTINGNRINDPTYDVGPFGNQFPLDLGLVERIEFIPGPGGAVYGQNAMFGVVNIITRRGETIDGIEMVAAAEQPQSMREGRLSLGRRLDSGLDLLVSASRLRADGEDLRLGFGDSGVAGVARGLDGERDDELFVRAARGPWSLDLAYGDRRKDDPTGAYFSDPLVPGQYQADRYAVGQLELQDRFADDTLLLSARLFVGRQRYRSQLSYGTRYSFPAKSDWHGAELRAVSSAWAGHRLMAGLELQDIRRQDQSVLDLVTPSNDLRIPGSAYRIGLYGQDEWRLADAVTATLGMRLDRSNIESARLSPRAALIWRAAAQTALKALYGRARRSPNAYERDYEDGLSQVANPSLGDETIETTELVVDHRVDSDLALRFSMYRWTMHDLVALGVDPASGLPQYRSDGTVRASGLELSADRTWIVGARLRGSVSYQSVGSAAGRGFPNSPRWLGRLSASSPLPLAGLRVGYEWQADGARRTLGGMRLGGYALSHLHLSTDTMLPGVSLSLALRNVFDKRHEHPGSDSNWQDALEQDGRSLRVQVRARF